jgi:hypothetical protein
MRLIASLLIFLLASAAMGATCTSTTRNNYVTNQVLTSSALNTDFNQLVTKVNAFDGGCITAGTLESDALNTTQFAPMLKGVKEGCKVSYSSASTISIGRCLAAVNGNFVTTAIATTASFGCTNCSAEVASTRYYVYIATGSSGTTLTPLILTTAPNEDGYDNSGNKVLARFYNNASSDIDQYSIDQWLVNRFVPQTIAPTSYTPVFNGLGTPTSVAIDFTREGPYAVITGRLTAGTTTAAAARIGLPAGLTSASTISTIEVAGVIIDSKQSTNQPSILREPSVTYMSMGVRTASASSLTKQNGNNVYASGDDISIHAWVPIEGWGE